MKLEFDTSELNAYVQSKRKPLPLDVLKTLQLSLRWYLARESHLPYHEAEDMLDLVNSTLKEK